MGDFGSADSKGVEGEEKSGTRLLAGELTGEAGRGAVSRVRTTATMMQPAWHRNVNLSSNIILAISFEWIDS